MERPPPPTFTRLQAERIPRVGVRIICSCNKLTRFIVLLQRDKFLIGAVFFSYTDECIDMHDLGSLSHRTRCLAWVLTLVAYRVPDPRRAA
jgi:hypothetical protein